ncbi:MAG: pyridoxamine 5'-phosphate oxidase family protein [Bacteroidota bacterium]
MPKLINKQVQDCIDRSVLCWLATSDHDHFPNVSPKEMFLAKNDEQLVIANIASPKSLKNIEINDKVCVSFIEVFEQKGFKLKGHAKIIEKSNTSYDSLSNLLINKYGDAYPIQCVFLITVASVHPIIAPSYFLYPEISDETRMLGVMGVYGVLPDESRKK